MKKSLATTLLLALVALTHDPSSALAEEEAPSASLAVGLYNQYVWRGEAWSKDSMVIQPSLTVGYKGFAFNLWGNMDTEQYSVDADETSNLNETDMTVSYGGTYNKIGYGVGYVYYGLEGALDPQEVFVRLSYDTLLSPSITVYREISGVQGWWYANAGISQAIPVSDAVSLSLGANVGYFDNDSTVSDFHDAMLSASLAIPVNKYITITPELHYSFALSNASEDYLKGVSAYAADDADHVYGGIAFTLSF